MDNAPPLWSVTAQERRLAYIAATAESIANRLQRDSEEGYAEVNNLAADVAWIARQLASVLGSMSCEGHCARGAYSTGETGADGCEARPPWQGHAAGAA